MVRVTFNEYLAEVEVLGPAKPVLPQDPQAQQEQPPVDPPAETASPEEKAPEIGVTQDSDMQGIIRKVRNAHLAYKRVESDGTFTELWVYNTGAKDKFRDELEIRKDILAGTDIAPNKTQSEDKTQMLQLWSAGNVQMMKITGLPN